MPARAFVIVNNFLHWVYLKTEILQINTALTSSVKAKHLLFIGSFTNCELNSILKAVKSHEANAHCPKKTVYPLKLKIGVNMEVNFDFGFSLLTAALRHWQTSSCCCCNSHQSFPAAEKALARLAAQNLSCNTRKRLHSLSSYVTVQAQAVA